MERSERRFLDLPLWPHRILDSNIAPLQRELNRLA
jgi:hypothetical protein